MGKREEGLKKEEVGFWSQKERRQREVSKLAAFEAFGIFVRASGACRQRGENLDDGFDGEIEGEEGDEVDRWRKG